MQENSTITQGFLEDRIFRIVSDTAESLGVRAFVIGGYVRDCFLGRPSKDIDIVVEGSGIRLAEACLLYTSPSPRDRQKSRMPSSA